MDSSPRARGFTLIELLVAITVLALVSVLGYRGLDSIVRTRLALTDDMERLRGLQLAFAQLQSDCAQVAGADELPGRQTLVADDGRLLLLRHTEADQQAPEFEVVSYRLADGQLTRQESAATHDPARLDQLWQQALADGGQAGVVRLQGGVGPLSMRLWVNGSWTGGSAPLAPGEAAAAPPAALELELQLQGRENSVVKVFLVGPA